MQGLNPEFMWELFVPKDLTYALRSDRPLTLPSKSTSETKSLVFRACQAWNHLPKVLKEASSLQEFKSGINQIDSIYCNCKSCS